MYINTNLDSYIYYLDMIATLGETTGISALQYIRDKMMNNPEGSKILQYTKQFKFKKIICTLYTIIYLYVFKITTTN